jgi:hypothetical protein
MLGNIIGRQPQGSVSGVWALEDTENGLLFPYYTFPLQALVIAGGGGGGAGASGTSYGGGGGAGGYRETFLFTAALNTAYTVTVGAGGAYTNTSFTTGSAGSNSVFNTITSNGGGGGAGGNTSTAAGSGGSGGGAAYLNTTGGAGNTSATVPVQGFRGGNYNTGGQGAPGGGALAVGSDTSPIADNGQTNQITGSTVTYSRGGDGFPGGTGGGSNNGYGGKGGRPVTGELGTNGGSGVVIIKIPSTRVAVFSGGVTSSLSTSVSGFNIYTVTATSTTSETVTFR